MNLLRCWCSNPRGGKRFAINLPLTTKQYKIDYIAKFVYYAKNSIRAWLYKDSKGLALQASAQLM